MPTLLLFHLELLRTELSRRKTQNQRYSLRAFARDLEMEPAALSRILAMKQQLSIPNAIRIVKRLQLIDRPLQEFVESVVREKTSSMTGVFKDHLIC